MTPERNTVLTVLNEHVAVVPSTRTIGRRMVDWWLKSRGSPWMGVCKESDCGVVSIANGICNAWPSSQNLLCYT